MIQGNIELTYLMLFFLFLLISLPHSIVVVILYKHHFIVSALFSLYARYFRKHPTKTGKKDNHQY